MGADLNCEGERGLLPIHYAIKFYDDVFLLKLLVDKGACVNEITCEGMSAIHFAAEKRNLDILKYVLFLNSDLDLEDEEGSKAGLFAAKEGLFGNVRFLVEHGANVKEKNNKGETAWQFLDRKTIKDFKKMGLV